MFGILKQKRQEAQINRNKRDIRELHTAIKEMCCHNKYYLAKNEMMFYKICSICHKTIPVSKKLFYKLSKETGQKANNERTKNLKSMRKSINKELRELKE